MPVYVYRCSECGHEIEKRRSVEMRNLVFFCETCGVGLKKRKFLPTANIAVPEHFKRKRGFHLPPKDSPQWEHMQPEGSGREKPKPTLTDEFRKIGLL